MTRRRLALIGLFLLITTALSALVACGDDDDALKTTAASASAVSSGGSTRTSAASQTSGANSSDLEYYTNIETIFTDTDSKISQAASDLNAARQAADNDLEKDKKAFDDYLNTYLGIVDDAVNNVNDLDPPGEASGPQKDFLDSVAEVRNKVEEFQNDLKDVKTADEEQALIDLFSTDVNATLDIANQACRGLQESADAAGAIINLDCPPAPSS